MDTALTLKNINKTFAVKHNLWNKKQQSSKQVLQNINLQIPKGQIFGLAGLNGIGKTTIIKIILDLINADTGQVKIFDKDHKMPIARANICYLPEKFRPSPYLTGYEFLQLSLLFYNKKLNMEETEKVSKQLDLSIDALGQIINKYSKGMGQKLGLMSCLLSGASLLILDEPMTGLDPKARVMLKEALKTYANTNKTIFFSSHILDDIEEIHNGSIKFYGKPNEFLEKYEETRAEKAFLKCIQ